MDRSASLLALAIDGFGPWLYRQPDPVAACDELQRLNERHRTIVLYTHRDGVTSIVAKPAFFTDDELCAGEQPIPYRANLYKTTLERVFAAAPPDRAFVFAIELEDGGFSTETVPIFSFQKRGDQNSVLVPDVDFLYLGFYRDERYDEIGDFRSKRDAAVFVGSTTGRVIDHRTIDEGICQRLASADYFRHSERVVFRLPNIVMCASPDVETRLRGLGHGSGHMTWREQLAYKYLLSMDGNGATCSRIALALKSNAVLLKYQSDSRLFYFSRLQPWVHYVPVYDDADVERILAMARALPDLFEAIAHQSRAFYEDYLVEPSVMRYFELALTIYSQSGPQFPKAQLDRFQPLG